MRLTRLTDHRSKFELMGMMLQTTHRECFDRRDGVYAIPSLPGEFGRAVRVEMDYEKGPSRVCQDLALRHIAHHKKKWIYC